MSARRHAQHASPLPPCVTRDRSVQVRGTPADTLRLRVFLRGNTGHIMRTLLWPVPPPPFRNSGGLFLLDSVHSDLGSLLSMARSGNVVAIHRGHQDSSLRSKGCGNSGDLLVV